MFDVSTARAWPLCTILVTGRSISKRRFPARAACSRPVKRKGTPFILLTHYSAISYPLLPQCAYILKKTYFFNALYVSELPVTICRSGTLQCYIQGWFLVWTHPLILGMNSSIERRLYYVMPSLIGQANTQIDPSNGPRDVTRCCVIFRTKTLTNDCKSTALFLGILFFCMADEDEVMCGHGHRAEFFHCEISGCFREVAGSHGTAQGTSSKPSGHDGNQCHDENSRKVFEEASTER